MGLAIEPGSEMSPVGGFGVDDRVKKNHPGIGLHLVREMVLADALLHQKGACHQPRGKR